MNASLRQAFARFVRPCLAVALFAGPFVLPSIAAKANPPLKRIALEIRDLKRLSAQLKQDETKLRKEREQLTRQLAHAKRYANGGRNAIHRTGFFALLKNFEQTPGQASFLQTYVPPLDPSHFHPMPEEGFAGGYPADLLAFCREHHLNLQYGGRAHLIIAELSRDLVYKTGHRIAELDQRIETCKAQNAAHNDLIGKLVLRADHYRGHYGYGHYGYGAYGHPTYHVNDHPLAGLSSQAYDRMGGTHAVTSHETVATDHQRLPFLVPSRPLVSRDSEIGKLARD